MGCAAGLLGLPPLGALATSARGGFDSDLWLELTAAPRSIALRAGAATRAWSYQARVIKGDPASAQALPGSYLGPILRVHRGQKLRIDFVNEIDQASIVHWHGLHVPDTMDGHPRFAVAPGGRYRYEFEVRNRAGTYWYHPHPHGHTGEQVYFGLAGLMLVSDDEEQALPLPRGEYELPVVIQDRTFGDDNQLRYLPDTGPAAARGGGASDTAPAMRGGMMGMMRGMPAGQGMGGMARVMGFFGDTILINGQPNAEFEVATHPYRLRVLNGSNSRIYKLAWQDGRPLTVIGTDGGLLQAPLHKDYVMLGPAERIDLWADFSQDAVDTQVAMLSLAFDGTMGSMMGMMGGSSLEGMAGGSPLAAGARMALFEIKVTRRTGKTIDLPRRLSTIIWPRLQDAINRAHPRTFRITMNGMQWGINDRSFAMTAVAADEVVKLGTTEVWEFVNDSGMMTMAHSMHIHDLQFQVLQRRHGAKGDGVRDGHVDQGWKDTVLLMPGERAKLLMRFGDYEGLYLYHCHMLEHEDDGLMRNYRVRA